MSALLDRYERDATILRARSQLADVIDLAGVEARRWNRIDRQMREDPDVAFLNLTGGIAGLEIVKPQIVNWPTITINATEALLWGGAAGTPIALNEQVPKMYRLFVAGTSTTAATPGTFTLNARLGTLITSPSLSGATGAITPVASATAAQWKIDGWLLLRTGGTAAVATGSLEFNQSATVGGGGPVSATGNAVMGGVSATFDATVASALVVGAIATTSTTNTFTPQSVLWGSWN
jgi:hypothetical protein